METSISLCQHYSVKRRSTYTNLLSTLSFILTNWEDGADTAILYADLSKAFDKVNHHLLLFKLKHQFNILGAFLDIISNSLKDRFFKVTSGSTSSALHPIYSGVPQGGVLSPILFSLYVNDLKSSLSEKVTVLQYADDLKILAAEKHWSTAITTL